MSASESTYLIEYSKSSRAGCRKCKGKISQGELRFGYVCERNGHMMTYWNHFACVSTNVLKKAASGDYVVEGVENLLESDQDLVKSAFAAADIQEGKDQASSQVPKKKRKIEAAADVSGTSTDFPADKENAVIVDKSAPRRSKRQQK